MGCAESARIRDIATKGFMMCWSNKKNIVTYNPKYMTKCIGGKKMVDMGRQEKKVVKSCIPILYCLLVWYNCQSSLVRDYVETKPSKNKKRKNEKKKSSPIKLETIG